MEIIDTNEIMMTDMEFNPYTGEKLPEYEG